MMKKTIRRIQRYADRAWFIPLICFVTFIDLFIIVIPTDGLVLLASLMRPKTWFWNAVLISTCCAFGAVALAIFAHHFGERVAVYFLGEHFFETKNWIRMSGWIEHYGFWGIAFIAIGPLPQQPAILIAGLARMNLVELFFAVWIGRFPKYLLYSYIGTQGPGWMKKHLGFTIEALEEEIVDVRTPLTEEEKNTTV
ncbi:MAG: VTT domain-containing protein [Cryobacterium sp.]|nr:VTT domain-containing protein [Oligoflexia bacterium]